MRDDITNNLIHLTKGVGSDRDKHREEAALIFDKILTERKLIGGTGFIKGKYTCVCFSEAPIGKLSFILADAGNSDFKYQPYGIMVSKKWLYEKGGLPVIYGPAQEFDSLPEGMRYRHVRFYLGNYDVDHSWEREWRLKTEELAFTPEDVTLVVPDRAAKEVFQEKHGNEWHFISLSDLGADISPL